MRSSMFTGLMKSPWSSLRRPAARKRSSPFVRAISVRWATTISWRSGRPFNAAKRDD